jgi:hypothetical protein
MSWQGDDLIVSLKRLLAPTLFIVVGTVVVQSIYRYFSSPARFRGLPLPPGPPRKWIIGNLTQMPKGDFVTQTIKWAKEFGESNRKIIDERS